MRWTLTGNAASRSVGGRKVGARTAVDVWTRQPPLPTDPPRDKFEVSFGNKKKCRSGVRIGTLINRVMRGSRGDADIADRRRLRLEEL